jgi:hypothetical protein
MRLGMMITGGESLEEVRGMVKRSFHFRGSEFDEGGVSQKSKQTKTSIDRNLLHRQQRSQQPPSSRMDRVESIEGLTMSENERGRSERDEMSIMWQREAKLDCQTLLCLFVQLGDAQAAIIEATMFFLPRHLKEGNTCNVPASETQSCR